MNLSTYIDSEKEKKKLFENIFVSCVGLALSALAFIAYNHPKGFEKVSLILLVVLAIASFSYWFWMLGFQAGFYKGKDGEGAFEDFLPIGFGSSVLISIGLYLYLKILDNLHKITGKE